MGTAVATSVNVAGVVAGVTLFREIVATARVRGVAQVREKERA